MRRFCFELAIILFLSMGAGVIYNHFIKSPLPLFKDYTPISDQDIVKYNLDSSISFNEIDAVKLKILLNKDLIVLLDARHSIKYKEGHIAKAISLPIGDFYQKYDEISHLLGMNKSIVVYCISVHCNDSELLARELNKKGHHEIFLYKGGIAEWKNLGYPVVK